MSPFSPPCLGAERSLLENPPEAAEANSCCSLRSQILTRRIVSALYSLLLGFFDLFSRSLACAAARNPGPALQRIECPVIGTVLALSFSSVAARSSPSAGGHCSGATPCRSRATSEIL